MNTMFITANIISDALKPLIDFFGWLLVAIHGVIGSWGWSIIAMTLLIRMVLLPLTIKQVRSMQAMQKLQPEIKKIQAKYKAKQGASADEKAKNRQALNQELQAFYRENEINPLMSCLPILAQMPVFISLFYLLRQQLKTDICPSITGWVKQQNALAAEGKAHLAHKLTVSNTTCGDVGIVSSQFSGTSHAIPAPTGQEFLFIPDLTAAAAGAVLIVLIALYVGTQLGSSLLMSATQDKMQRNIMLLMPLAFVFFIVSFPAGLILYWITTNTWTIGQQVVVKRLTGGLTPAAASPAAMAAAVDDLEEERKRPAKRIKDSKDSDEGGSAQNGESQKGKGTGGPPPKKSNRKRTGRRR